MTSEPEDRLVAAWAARRATMLAQMAEIQRAFVEQIESMRSTSARDPSSGTREQQSALLRRTELLAGQVQWFASQHRAHRSHFELSPAMQRDHRLRRLVRAFARTSEERWAAVDTDERSTAPPLKATHVFELWCFPRLVAAFLQLGWIVQRRGTHRTHADGGRPVHHHVELARSGSTIVLEYQPLVNEPSIVGLSEAHQRALPGVEFLATGATEDGLISYGRKTPDFAVKLCIGDGRRAFAIGDATLTSAERGFPEKADAMTVYRDRIAWRVDGRVIRCPAMGTFVMLPGPRDAWIAARTLQRTPSDSILLFPFPGPQPDPDFLARTEALVDVLFQAAL